MTRLQEYELMVLDPQQKQLLPLRGDQEDAIDSRIAN